MGNKASKAKKSRSGEPHKTDQLFESRSPSMDKIPIDIPPTPQVRETLQGGSRKKPASTPAPPAQTHGALRVTSQRNVRDVIIHVRSTLQERGLKLFAEIDHSAEAEAAGLKLPPTVVFIFGNPAVGTMLMQANNAVSLELPLRLAVYRDAGLGCTVLSYHAPSSLAHQFALDDHLKVQAIVSKMDALLADICKTVANDQR